MPHTNTRTLITTALLAVTALATPLFADRQTGRPPAKPDAPRTPATLARAGALAFAPRPKERRKVCAALESALKTAETEGAAAALRQLKAAVKPDLCAPSGITSAAYAGAFSGTSASTPHAAALAALVKSVYPYLTAEQLKAYLERYGNDIAPVGKDNASGAGAAQLPTLLAVIEGEALKATALTEAGGDAVLHFTGLPGELYTVMARESLTAGAWQSLGTAAVAADGTASFTDPAPLPPTRFYKFVKP